MSFFRALILVSFINISFAQQSKIDSLKKIDPIDNKHSLSIYMDIGRYHSIPDSIIFYNKKALLLAKSIKYDSLFYIYNNLATGAVKKLQHDSAYFYIDKAKDYISNTDNITISNAYLLSLEGTINENLGRTDIAELKYDEVEELLLKMEDLPSDGLKMLSSNYINKGVIYQKKGEYKEAISIYLKALESKKKLKEHNQVMIVLNNIAGIYSYIDDPTKAFKYYAEMHKISKRENNSYMGMYALTGLGAMSYKTGQIKKAVNYYDSSLVYAEKFNDAYNKNVIYENLSSIYEEENDINKAKFYASKGVELAKEIENNYLLVANQNNLAEILIKEKEYKIASDLLRANEGICVSDDYKNYLKDTYLIFSDLYEKQSQYKLALEKYKEYKVLNDSIINSDKLKAIDKLELDYKTLEKDKKILEQEKTLSIKELQIEKNKTATLLLILFIIALMLLFSIYGIRKLKSKIKRKELENAFRIGFNNYLLKKYNLKENEYQLWLKIVDGLSEKDIASHFYRSIHTIKGWRKTLYKKLNSTDEAFKQKHAIDLYNREINSFKSTSKATPKGIF